MIELEKNFNIEILRNGGGDCPIRVKSAFPSSQNSGMDLTAQQARALAIDLIKAAYLVQARPARVGNLRVGDELD